MHGLAVGGSGGDWDVGQQIEFFSNDGPFRRTTYLLPETIDELRR